MSLILPDREEEPVEAEVRRGVEFQKFALEPIGWRCPMTWCDETFEKVEDAQMHYADDHHRTNYGQRTLEEFER